MMGERQTDHPALFYEFSLERHVPGDHLLRSIDRFVDLGDIREQLRRFYSDTGRDAVRPPQAYPEAGPPAPAGSEWCQGRVPPRRHRPKPPQARQVDPDPAAGARLRGATLTRPDGSTWLEAPTGRLLQP